MLVVRHYDIGVCNIAQSTGPGDEYRKRLRRRESPADVRFVTFSTYRRIPLFQSAAIKDVFARQLVACRAAHCMELFAWVVMPEHVHMLARMSGSPWNAVARSLKTQISKQVLERWRQLNAPILRRIEVRSDDRIGHRFWQHGGGFDRNVRSMSEFVKAVRYIHRNPVERGLVGQPEEWKWSSVRWWAGVRDGEVECDPPPGEPGSWEGWRGYR